MIPVSGLTEESGFGIHRLRGLLKDRLLRNAGYLLGVTIVGSVSGFVFWTLAARLYTTEEVGLASSVISIIQLLAGIASLGLGVGLVRYLSESDDPSRTLNATFTLTFLTSLAVGAAYLIGIEVWSPTLRILARNPLYAGGFMGFLVVAVLGMLMQMAYLALRRAELGFWQVVVMNALRLTLVVILASMGGVGVVAALCVAMLAAEAVGMFVFMPRLAKGFRPRLRWSTEVTGTLVPYSIANYLADLLYRAPLLLAPPLALERLGANSSAHAYVAWMIGSILASPGLSLATSAFAEGSHAPSDLRPTLLRAGRYAAMFTLPIALLTFAGASWILAIFGRSYADEGAALLRWLALTAPLMVFVGLYFSALRVRKRIRELVLLSGLICATTLVVPLLAIDRYGLSSMGAGWLVGHALVSFFVGMRLLRGRDFIYPETEKVGFDK